GLVDGQGTALELLAVEGRDRLVGAVGHLHETEAAGAAGLAVADHLGPGHGAVLAEHLRQVVGGGREGQVAHVQVLAHRSSFAGPQAPRVTTHRPAAQRPRQTWRTGPAPTRSPGRGGPSLSGTRLDVLGGCEARGAQSKEKGKAASGSLVRRLGAGARPPISPHYSRARGKNCADFIFPAGRRTPAAAVPGSWAR